MSDRPVTVGDSMYTLSRNGVSPIEAYKLAAYMTVKRDSEGPYFSVNGERWAIQWRPAEGLEGEK